MEDYNYMNRVLIADDEQEIRDAILLLGDWDGLNLEIVGQAENGDQLCEMIETSSPDIVITDMKMPGLSGGELIKRISVRHNDIKIIIISGFQDIEYFKQAISSKVVEYLLKPISEENLNNALRSASRELDIQTRMKEQLHRAFPFMKARAVSEFINGRGNWNEEEYLHFIGNNLPDRSPSYTAGVLACVNYNEVCKTVFEADTRAFEFALLNITNELVEGVGIAFCIGSFLRNQIVILFYGESNRERLCKLMQSVAETLGRAIHVHAVAGVGRAYPLYTDVRRSIEEGRLALMRADLKDKNQVLAYERIAARGKMETISSINKLSITKQVFEMNAANWAPGIMLESINNVFDTIDATVSLNIYSVRKISGEIVSVLEKRVDAGDVKEAYFEQLVRLRQKIDGEFDPRCIREYLTDFAQNMAAQAYGKREGEDTLSKIKAYIDENYTQKLTLNDLAQRFYWSKEYISKVFKEKYGCNFYEYLTALRIETAKSLLRDPTVNRSAIYEMLGFTDNSHFSKSFKKHTGMTPREFAHREKT